MKFHFEKILPGPGESFVTEEMIAPTLDCVYHIHPECELTWIESGFGSRFIGDSIEPFSAGDLVLIRRQDYAEAGQIVACRVNGDEATLKRYRPQPHAVVLMPENSDYEPQIVSARDFETGYAGIIGVAIEVRHKL